MPDIAVLAGRSERRLELLLEAQLQRNLKDGVLRLLVSPDERTLALAQRLGIETLVPADDETMASALAQRCDPAIIVRTTWCGPLPADFCRRFANRIIAMRAALPGQFPDGDPVSAAWESGRRGEIRWSGCHVFQLGPDGAPARIMRQLVVPVSPGDDFARFSKRMALGERWVLLKSIKQLLYEMRSARARGRQRRGRRKG